MASLNHNFCVSEREMFLHDELDSSGKTGGVFSLARRVVATTLPRKGSERAFEGGAFRLGFRFSASAGQPIR
jgi:hypothetical protein